MFDKKLLFSDINTRNNPFVYNSTKQRPNYSSIRVDIAGNRWGWIEESNIFQNVNTGAQVTETELTRRDIDYLSSMPGH